jgi:hypothetical protein
MSDIVLVGPFWTRSEAASYLGISGGDLRQRTDVLRVGGHWLEETYPAFQFRDGDVRHEVAAILEEAGDELTGAAIADWLSRANPMLGTMSPIAWFDAGLSLKTALTAIHADLEDIKQRVPAPAVRRAAS